MTNKTLYQARDLFHHYHSKVMGEISSMLRRAKLTSVMHLAGERPTFSETARELEYFANIVKVLAPLLHLEQQAEALVPYIEAVKRLGEAIDSGCEDSLGEAIAELDQLPYI